MIHTECIHENVNEYTVSFNKKIQVLMYQLWSQSIRLMCHLGVLLSRAVVIVKYI